MSLGIGVEPLDRREDVFCRLAAWFAHLGSWRRCLVGMLLGGLAAAALPPTYLVPLLWPAFTGLLWLLDGNKRVSGAFLTGWSFGTGYFLAGIYWVGIAFLVDAEQFAALLPFAVAGLAAGLALFPAFAVLAVWWSGRRGVSRILLLAASWLTMEWVRSWLFTGFPWNLIGSVWTVSDAVSQLAALCGVWGLSLLTVLVAAAPATLSDGPGNGPLRRWAPSVGALILVGLVWGGGLLRLSAAPALGEQGVPGVLLRLVQPSVEQSAKWQAELRRKHVLDQMALTTADSPDGWSGRPTHVIWAETAVPFYLAGDPALREAIAEVVPEGGLLITGAPRLERKDGSASLWNSLHALDDAGNILETFDKFHLVPFGEYMPLKWLFGLSKITAGRLDFSPGPGLRTLNLPGLPPVGPLICYEIIFPGRVIGAGPRPAWLLNLTNDAWFGTSSGPYQHLASAKLRAVEEGVPVVRVANSGISAVIDSFGRVVRYLPLNEIGVLDSSLPQSLGAPPPFARIGNWIVLVLVLPMVMLACCPFRKASA